MCLEFVITKIAALVGCSVFFYCLWNDNTVVRVPLNTHN